MGIEGALGLFQVILRICDFLPGGNMETRDTMLGKFHHYTTIFYLVTDFLSACR